MCTYNNSLNFGEKANAANCQPTILRLEIGDLESLWICFWCPSVNGYMHQVVRHHTSEFFSEIGKSRRTEILCFLFVTCRSLSCRGSGSTLLQLLQIISSTGFVDSMLKSIDNESFKPFFRTLVVYWCGQGWEWFSEDLMITPKYKCVGFIKKYLVCLPPSSPPT